MDGKIESISAEVVGGKLSVRAEVKCDGIETVSATLPGREKAALIPRSIILGDCSEADESKLTEIQEILSKLTIGRPVRMWEYRDTMYFAFLSWADVSFLGSEANSPNVA